MEHEADGERPAPLVRWVIEFHNGDYLFGELPNGTTPQSALTWTLEQAGTAEPKWAPASRHRAHRGGGYPAVAAVTCQAMV